MVIDTLLRWLHFMTSSAETTPAGHSVRVILVLLMVHLVYALDRTAPIIIAEEVKREFDLSDGQMGIYTGLAFGVSFAVAGVLIGPVIDRFNRSRLLAGMLLIWSGMTAAAAAVGTFWQLLTLRTLVGAAEAGGSPTILSILSDVVSPAKRGTAIGIYKLGAPMGYLAASVGCAYIATHYGWRAALLIAGLPGIILALAVLRWIPDPSRGKLDAHHKARDTAFSLREIASLILHGPGIWPFILGLCLYSVANLAMQAFTIPYMIRLHGLSLQEAGMYYGIASGIGVVSPIVLGLINDRMVRNGIEWSGYLGCLIAVMTFLASALMLVSIDLVPVIAGLFLWMTLMSGITAVIFAAVITITPPRARGTILSVLLVASMAVGSGVGPVLLGSISDLLGGGTAVKPAGLIMVSLNLLAGLCFFGAGRSLRTSPAAANVVVSPSQ